MEAIKIWWHDGVCGKITSYNYHAYAKCKHRHAFYWSFIWILYCRDFQTVGCIYVSGALSTFIVWANFWEQDLSPFNIVIRAGLRMTIWELDPKFSDCRIYIYIYICTSFELYVFEKNSNSFNTSMDLSMLIRLTTIVEEN